jgi:membrane peptidoglycan carboxypeptidase
MGSRLGELFINPASAAWSPKAAQRAGLVSNSLTDRVARNCLWPQSSEAGTARPVTAIDRPTHDVSPESAGRDESADQLNESADASKQQGMIYKPFARWDAVRVGSTDQKHHHR